LQKRSIANWLHCNWWIAIVQEAGYVAQGPVRQG
jgi:hypothetical protein